MNVGNRDWREDPLTPHTRLMEERAYATITIDKRERVLTITMNVPERRNALSPLMVNELLWALDDARDDDQTHVIVLTGAGAAFSAGADLSQLSGSGPDSQLESKGDYADLLLRFRALGKPTIARVPGPAMGGGLGLVASCDLAIACESAVLGTPEVKRGLWPMQIMAVLGRLVPRRKLLEMMLLGDKLPAATALEIGLLTRVVPDAELDDAVHQLATALASRSPTAMREGLRAFHVQADQPLDAALPYLRDQLAAILATEDAREGLLAFMQKREPEWTGR